MTATDRISMMKQRLNAAFQPTHLDIRDDSAQHRGHVGARGGAGHYTLTIASPVFVGKSRIEAHRLIYGEFSDWIPHEIHALSIQILSTS